MVITIDGPAGSGKSTAARLLATRLGLSFLDTGATYRAVTLRAMNVGVDLADEAALADCARQMDLHMTPRADGVHVMLDGVDVSLAIRSEAVSANAKYAANAPSVRGVLVDLQRKIGRELGDFVTEGRDQGTVVFPDADLKFYVQADSAARAARRVEQLAAQGETADVETVRRAIEQRDASDRNRDVGPLAVPAGAIVIDTSEHTIEETQQLFLEHVDAWRKEQGGA